MVRLGETLVRRNDDFCLAHNSDKELERLSLCNDDKCVNAGKDLVHFCEHQLILTRIDQTRRGTVRNNK